MCLYVVRMLEGVCVFVRVCACVCIWERGKREKRLFQKAAEVFFPPWNKKTNIRHAWYFFFDTWTVILHFYSTQCQKRFLGKVNKKIWLKVDFEKCEVTWCLINHNPPPSLSIFASGFPFICLFLHLFVCSFVQSNVCFLLLCLSGCLFIATFVYLLVCSPICLCVLSAFWFWPHKSRNKSFLYFCKKSLWVENCNWKLFKNDLSVFPFCFNCPEILLKLVLKWEGLFQQKQNALESEILIEMWDFEH